MKFTRKKQFKKKFRMNHTNFSFIRLWFAKRLRGFHRQRVCTKVVGTITTNKKKIVAYTHHITIVLSILPFRLENTNTHKHFFSNGFFSSCRHFHASETYLWMTQSWTLLSKGCEPLRMMLVRSTDKINGDSTKWMVDLCWCWLLNSAMPSFDSYYIKPTKKTELGKLTEGVAIVFLLISLTKFS